MASTSITSDPISAKLPAAATPKSSIGTDFNMFLKLLTTQMQNQDPLSPMDSTQYTQQLVQYSQVEQSVKQSGTLTDILASLSRQSMAQANGFIGREAVFDSAVSGLGSKPATWTYATERPAASATLTISDAAGKVVATRTVGATAAGGDFSWDGTLSSGSKAANGPYTLSIAAVDAAGAAVPITVRSTGTVTEVNAKNGAFTLGVNGVQMPLESVVRLAAGN